MVGVPPKTSTDALHAFTNIPLVSDRHDALKSAFLANCQLQPADSPARRALNCSQERLLPASCFSDITSLLMYRTYAIECRNNPRVPFLETLAKIKVQFREKSVQNLRLRCARAAAFPRSGNLFVDLSKRSSRIAAKITQWILGLLSPYGSMCTLCSGLRFVSASHFIRTHEFNPDPHIACMNFELAAFELDALSNLVLLPESN